MTCMQMSDANELRRRHGGEPCDHDWEKEYYLGSATGDYVCRKCGITGAEFKAKRQKSEPSQPGPETP